MQKPDQPVLSTISRGRGSRSVRQGDYVSLIRRLRTQFFTCENAITLLGRIGLLLTVGLAWQLAGAYQIINPVFCGIPSRIIIEFINAIAGPILSVDAVSTVSAAIVGAAAASVLGGDESLIPILRYSTGSRALRWRRCFCCYLASVLQVNQHWLRASLSLLPFTTRWPASIPLMRIILYWRRPWEHRDYSYS